MTEASTYENSKFKISKVDSVEKKPKKDKEKRESLVFPDGVSLLARNKKEIGKLHGISQNIWDDAYNYETILEITTLLKNDTISRRERKKLKANLSKKDKNKLKQKGVKLKDVLSKKDRKNIKGKLSKKKRKKIITRIVGIRKIGIWNRSMLQLCDETHQAPKELHNLLVQMGKLKDFPGKEVKYANKVESSLKKYNKNKKKIDKQFKPCSSKSFRKELRNTEQKMDSILQKQKPKQVEIGHDLRKEGTRIFMSGYKSWLYLHIKTKRLSVIPYMQAYEYFVIFDNALGRIHDEVIKEISLGNKAKMEIGDDIRKPLRKGLAKQSKQWDKEIKKANKKSQKNNKNKHKKKK